MLVTFVGSAEIEFSTLLVGVLLGVGEGSGAVVGFGVSIGSFGGVGVLVCEFNGLGVGVELRDGTGVGATDVVAEGLGVDIGVAEGVGFEVRATATPAESLTTLPYFSETPLTETVIIEPASALVMLN